MSTKDGEIAAELWAMADQHGEIAFTSNTRSLLELAQGLDLVKPVSGKFRMIEEGKLNSIYRINPWVSGRPDVPAA